MSHRLTSWLGVLAAGAAVAAAGSAGAVRAAADPIKRTVFVSVLDKDHVPVTDMQAADFEVKEGGKTMEIVSVKRATTPLRIAIIDADAGTGAYQQGLLQFMQKLLDHAEFAITSVLVQPQKLVDYSSDTAALSKALDAVGKRGVQRGAQLMEAIEDATKTVGAPGKRSVILVLRTGGEGTSSLNPKDVREDLRKSGAALYVLSVRNFDRGGFSPRTSGAPMDSTQQQTQLRQDEVNEGQQNLQLVLGDGSRESGGHHDEIVSVSMAKSVELVADELLNQYEVTYALPDVKPSDKLSVSTKRKNVNLYAPNHPPN